MNCCFVFFYVLHTTEERREREPAKDSLTFGWKIQKLEKIQKIRETLNFLWIVCDCGYLIYELWNFVLCFTSFRTHTAGEGERMKRKEKESGKNTRTKRAHTSTPVRYSRSGHF